MQETDRERMVRNTKNVFTKKEREEIDKDESKERKETKQQTEKQEPDNFLQLSKKEQIEWQLKQYHTKEEQEQYKEMVEKYRQKVEGERRLAEEIEQWKKAKEKNPTLKFMQWIKTRKKK